MAEHNLKGPHVSCLYYIYKSKSLTATELCELSTEDKAAVSRSIDYLEKNGFLTEKSSGRKKYRAPIELTEKGKEVAMKVAEKVDRVIEMAGEGLSDHERDVLYMGLSKISDNLDRICLTYDGKNQTMQKSVKSIC